MTTNMTDAKDTKLDSSLTKIDAALRAAEARKAQKALASGKATPANKSTTSKTTASPAKPRLTEDEKAKRAKERETERAERKAKKDAERAAKKAEKDASKKPAHMLKVQKAAAKLPALNEQANIVVNDITSNFSQAQVAAISLHLQHFNRVKATERALTQKVEAGMTVKIVGGDPRFIGMTGTVDKAQRIRCYVNVASMKKPVYLYTSDVQVSTAKAAKTGK